MTAEEKVKAYDEAMNKIKPLYEQAKKDGNPVWSTYEYLFPELKESKDERIRMALFDIVRDVPYMETELRVHGLTVEKTLAYLEKQKDYNKLYEDIDKSGWFRKEYIDKCIDEEFEQKEQKLTNEYQNWELIHEFVEKFGRIPKDEDELNALVDYVLKRQKPAEFDEYKIIKKHITEDSLSSEVNKRLKECGWYVTDEKPVEWSEEDEKRVKQLIYDTEYIRAEYEKRKKELGESFNDELIKDCDEQIAWLKSLCPQPKIEWNKEDEKMLRLIRNAFKNGAMSTIGQDQWLKSLPERFNLQPEKTDVNEQPC